MSTALLAEPFLSFCIIIMINIIQLQKPLLLRYGIRREADNYQGRTLVVDKTEKKDLPLEIEISDDDIFEAMKDIKGYLDITPADLKEIYKFAYRHAYDRIMKSVRARDIMTREVFAVRKSTPLREVANVMADKGISGVPVLEDDGTIAGVISGKVFLANMRTKGT